MKSQSFISIGLFLLISCNVNNNNKIIKSDLVLENIQGKVYSLKEFSYEANENYGTLIRGNRSRRSTLDHDFYKIYDTYGRKIEEGKYDDYSNGGLIYKLIYTYDKKGNLIEGNYFSTNNEFLRKQSYVYDEFDNLVEKVSINFDGSFAEKLTYVYDILGNNIEENIYNQYNQITKMTYKYDSIGNKIEEKSLFGNGSISVLSKYNERGFLIEDNKEHLPSSNLNSKTTYKYDINGNKIEENSDGSWGEKLTYKYEYDSHHNWTSQVLFKEGKPLYIIEREILYYE